MTTPPGDLSALLASRLAARLVPGVRDETVPAVASLAAFKARLYRRYVHAAHLEVLDRALEDVVRYVETRGAEGTGRLVIAMPPRHGKSLTTSKLLPAWFLGRNPDKRVMLVSYGQSMATKNSRTARNLVASAAYRDVFPAVRLAEDSQSVSEWNIAGREGGADALGILGAAAGKGAHLLVIDDPHKNRAEAESVTLRDKVWDAYGDDLYTRLEPGGAVIVMATRWHEDDLTGRLLRTRGDEWAVLSLPGIAEEGDPLGREVGAALWPEMFDEAALDARRRTLGPYGFAALYQQNPRPAEGGIFKPGWFKPYARVMPEREEAVRYWDLAMSSKTSADYTVGVRLERGKDGLVYVTDIARGQVELADLPRWISDVMRSDGPDVRQGFEMAGYTTRAVQALVKRRELAAYQVKGYRADTDKLTRALPFAARAALETVRVVVGPGAVDRADADAFVDELAAFPNGAHDDQVDAVAGAWMMINEVKRTRTATAKSYIG
jgi:predicted phage terminase large subunit-like protein